jgi:hypothetical protein
MMDAEIVPPYRPAWDTSEVKEVPDPRERLLAALAKEGLSYGRGGYIHGANLTGPSKSLGAVINAILDQPVARRSSNNG